MSLSGIGSDPRRWREWAKTTRSTSHRPNADDLRAKVFQDRIVRDVWRVEKMDKDGGSEAIEVFTGPNARQRAIDYAHDHFGDFDEIELAPYRG